MVSSSSLSLVLPLCYLAFVGSSPLSELSDIPQKLLGNTKYDISNFEKKFRDDTDLSESRSKAQQSDWSTRSLVNFDEVYEGSDISIEDMQYNRETIIFGSTLSESVEVNDSTIFNIKSSSFSINFDAKIQVTNVDKDIADLNYRLSNVKMTVPLPIPLNEDLFLSIIDRSLLRPDDIFPCLFNAEMEAAAAAAAATASAAAAALNISTYSDRNAALLFEDGSVIQSKSMPNIVYTNSNSTTPTVYEYTVEGQTEDELSNSMQTFLDSNVLNSVPEYGASLSELLIRSTLENEIFVQHIMKVLAADALRCPRSYIDFRDFFLSSEDSYLLGGSGLKPYGDVGVFANSLVQEQLSQVDETGSVALNSLLETIIEVDSDALQIDLNEQISGALESLPIDLLDGSTINKFKLGINNVRLQNLNTISDPLKLLEPISQPHRLENKITFGPVPGKRISAKMNLKIDIDAGPLISMNEIGLGFFVDSIDTSMDLTAMIVAEDLINLGFNDIINPFCWLSLIPKPGSDDLDVVQEGSAAKSHYFGIKEFKSEINGFAANVKCVECESEALGENLALVNPLLSLPLVTNKIKPEMQNFIQTLMLSECVQNSFDQALALSPRLCDNNPEYNSTFSSDELISMVVPSDPLSCVGLAPTFDNIEKFALWGSLLVQVGFTVFAKAIAGTGDDSDQSSYSRSETKDSDFLFDFSSDSGDLLHTAIQLGSNIINNWLGYPSSLAGGASTLGINRLMEKYFLDDGVFSYSFGSDVQFEGDTFKVELSGVNVIGLTSFKKFEIFKIRGPQQIENLLELGELLIELDIKVIPMKEGKVDDGKESYDMTYEIAMENVALSVAMVLEIYEERLSFDNFNMDELLPCIASMLHGLEFTELKLTAGVFNLVGIKGYPSAQITQDAGLFTTLLSAFGGGGDALPIMTNDILRDLINTFSADYLNGNPTCPMPSKISNRSRKQESENTFVDFREIFSPSEEKGEGIEGIMDTGIGGIIDILIDIFLNEWMVVDPNTNLAAINTIVFGHPGSSEYFNNLTFTDILSSQSSFVNGWVSGSFGLGISDLSLRNIDTIGSPLSLMEVTADEPYYLNNSMAVGVGGNAMELSFMVDFNASFYGGLIDNTNNPTIKNKFEVTMMIDDLALVINGIYKILQSQAKSFSPIDVADLNCVLSLFETPEVSRRGVLNTIDPSIVATLLAVSMGNVDVGVNCIECTSPLLKALEKTLLRPDSPTQITEILNAVIKSVIEKAEESYLYNYIARLMVDAPMQCKSNPNYDPDFKITLFRRMLKAPFDVTYPGLLNLSLACIILLFVAGAFGVAIRCGMSRKHKHWVDTLEGPEKSFLVEEQKLNKKIKTYVDSTTTSMIRSKCIPSYIRYSMPVVVVINIVLFISGHLDHAGGVGITLTIFGEIQSIDDIKQLSIVGTTELLWTYKLYIPAIIVVTLSIVWPYVKQIINLLIWILPPTVLPTSVRGSTLYWIDTLGKWSIVDVFIMICLIVGLRSTISSPGTDFLPEDLYKFDLYVTPLWGMYTNMIAQILSQICSHVYIYYHRKIVTLSKDELVVSSSTSLTVYEPTVYETTLNGCSKSESISKNIKHNYKETSPNLESNDGKNNPTTKEIDDGIGRLCRYNFSRTHRNKKNENDLLVLKKNIVDPIVIFTAMAILVGTFLYFVVPGVTADTLGLFGILTRAGRSSGSSADVFNLSDFFVVLYEQTKFFKYWYEKLGLIFFGTLFVWSVILVPILLTLSMLRLWFIPLTIKERKRMLDIAEILVAWEYSEVFLFALVILVWQTEMVTSGWVRGLCKPLDMTFRELSYYGVVEPKDAQCYTRVVSVGNAQYIMLATVVMIYFLTSFVTMASNQYLRESEIFLYYKNKKEETELGSYDSEGDNNCNKNSDDTSKIEPLPPQFTDTFRFLFGVETYCNTRNV